MIGLSERAGFERDDRETIEKTSKKLKKVLKNPLTKASGCDIINKPSERGQQNPQKRITEAAQRCAKSPKLIEN